MIRGTNAQFKINLPYDRSDIFSITIVFWQKADNGEMMSGFPIVKYLNHCSNPSPRTLLLTLNQDETLRFSSKRKGYMQYRGLLTDGNAFGDKEKLFNVYPMYNESPFEDETFPSASGDPIVSDGWIILDGTVVGENQ